MNDLQIDLLHQDYQLTPDKEPKKGKGRCLLFLFVLLVILGTASCVVKRYTVARWPNDASIYDPTTLKPKNYSFLNSVKNLIFQSDNVLVGQTDDRVNILLLGMGGPGHDGPYLTDTNMVVSIKPSTKEVAMLSIPRDLGVEIPGYGFSKINHANSYGESKNAGAGGEFARGIFAKTLNLDIPYYVRVDFKAFTDLIDTVGGVNINVEKAFSDYMFPGENNSYQTIVFTAGTQLMNGTRALEYARSRHGTNGEGSDFARARRQQQVITALKEKLLAFGTYTNPIKVQKIITTLAGHITTNLDFGQIMYLASLGRELQSNPRSIVLDNATNGFLISNNSPTSGYLLLPKTGNFDEINSAFDNIFSTDPSLLPTPTKIVNVPEQKSVNSTPVFNSAKIEVQNGTWIVGLASRMEKRLTESGFSISSVGNSSKRPISQTTIYLISPKTPSEITTALSNELNAVVEKTLPDWLKAGYNTSTISVPDNKPKYKPDTDILLILGEDINQ